MPHEQLIASVVVTSPVSHGGEVAAVLVLENMLTEAWKEKMADCSARSHPSA